MSTFPKHIKCGETMLVVLSERRFDIISPEGNAYKGYFVPDTGSLGELGTLLAGDWKERDVNETVMRINDDAERRESSGAPRAGGAS